MSKSYYFERRGIAITIIRSFSVPFRQQLHHLADTKLDKAEIKKTVILIVMQQPTQEQRTNEGRAKRQLEFCNAIQCNSPW